MDVGVKMPLLSNPPAIIIKYDEGGEVSKYVQREREWEAKGRRIIVRGLCGSACTLYLKSPYLCAEPSAQFVFHASYFRYGKLGTATTLKPIAICCSGIRLASKSSLLRRVA
jgi:hypothetical protein